MSRASSSRVPFQSYSQPNPTRPSDFEELLYSQTNEASQDGLDSARRPACPECGTRKMRLRSGLLICKRGHVQKHFRVEATDDDEFLGDGVSRTKRRLEKIKVRKLKSQYTPHYSVPDTDVEPDDSEELDDLLSGLEPTTSRPGSAPRTPTPSVHHRRGSLPSSAIQNEEEEDAQGFESDFEAKATRSYGPKSIWTHGVGLHGFYEGRFLSLQCLQLVLRLQLHALRQEWGDRLPTQTEAVARDLWSMLVSQLPMSHYPPEPLIAATFDWHTRNEVSQEDAAVMFPHVSSFDPETETRDYRRRTMFDRYRAFRKKGNVVVDDDDSKVVDQIDEVVRRMGTSWAGDGEGARARRSQSSLVGEDEDLPDPEDQLAELDPIFAQQRRDRERDAATRPNRETSDARAESSTTGTEVGFSEDESENDARTRQFAREADNLQPNQHNRQTNGQNGKKRKKTWASRSLLSRDSKIRLGFAKLPSTISIVYLSLWLLKVPVLWSDLYSLIESYKLPYLNAVHRLPISLTRSLNRDDVGSTALATDRMPSITTLHLHTLKLATFYNTTYNICFGDGNQSGILLRLVREMMLPPTFYVAAKRILSAMEGLSANLNPNEQGPLDNAAARSRQSNVYKNDKAFMLRSEPKEFVIMSALLMVIKLRYGFDGRCDRYDQAFTSKPSDGDSQAADQGAISCTPDLKSWLNALDRRSERQKWSVESVWDVDQGLEALDMTDEQMEAYALFAEQNLVLSNDMDLHEWRRKEQRQKWSIFTDFLPPPPPSAGDGRDARDDESTPQQQEMEDLKRLYKHHIQRPHSCSVQGGKEAGCCYMMHRFTAEGGSSGLSYSRSYTRLLSHANRLLGIQQTSSPGEYSVWQRVHASKVKRKELLPSLETTFGIQGYLELFEDLVLNNTQFQGGGGDGSRTRKIAKLLPFRDKSFKEEIESAKKGFDSGRKRKRKESLPNTSASLQN